MGSSEEGEVSECVSEPQIRSSVQVVQKKDAYRSDGEIDDSDDDYHDDREDSNRNRKDVSYKSRSRKTDSYVHHSDNDRQESKKRDRYSDHSDNERSYKRERYNDRGDKERDRDRYSDHSDKESSGKRYKYKHHSDNERSYKRDRYSDHSDGEKNRSKRSKRVDYDHDDGNDDYYHDKRNRRHKTSSYYDDDNYHNNNRKDNDYRGDKRSNNDADTSRHNDKKVCLDTKQTKEVQEPKSVVENKDVRETKRKLTVGAYIPPSKLREMQAGITDKNSKEYQRMSWEALKKSVNGLVNKVNTQNIEFIVAELIRENIVRGRGIVTQTIIRAQVASPTFTSVYASFVAIINTKFPKIGELVLRRLIIQFRKAYKRNDKRVCINSVKFIAHLVNQQVAHELLALQILTLMLHNHTGDSVEVAVSFLKDVGQKLLEVSPKGVNAVFERLRNILHDSLTDKRVQYMIEVIFHSRRDNFRDFAIIPEGLDNVEEDEQITHLLQLDEDGNEENILNVFKFDPDFIQNEEKYNQIKKNILDDSDDSSGDEEDSNDDEDEDDDEENKEETQIIDMTQTNLVALRRKLFLTIQSSLDFEECAHKMMKIDIKDGQQHEFCLMVVESCMQDRSYQKFFGNLARRFCMLRREFMDQYVNIFKEQYGNCHHLDTNKLRNTAKLFGHLLWSDGIPWAVLECIKLNEEETTSSSRIFIKILFQEISEFLGIEKLLKRLKDPTIEMYLDGLFPRDDPVKTRFAINFFTAIGLGVITADLREHLKTMPKVSTAAQKMAAAAGLGDSSSSSSSDSSDSSSGSDSSDSSSGSSSSDSSDSEDDKHNSMEKEKKRTPEDKDKIKKKSRRSR